MNFSSYHDGKEMVYQVNGRNVSRQEWSDSMDKWSGKSGDPMKSACQHKWNYAKSQYGTCDKCDYSRNESEYRSRETAGEGFNVIWDVSNMFQGANKTSGVSEASKAVCEFERYDDLAVEIEKIISAMIKRMKWNKIPNEMALYSEEMAEDISIQLRKGFLKGKLW